MDYEIKAKIPAEQCTQNKMRRTIDFDSVIFMIQNFGKDYYGTRKVEEKTEIIEEVENTLSTLGKDYTAEEINIRFKTLKQSYNSHRKRLESGEKNSWRFYSEMDKALQGKPDSYQTRKRPNMIQVKVEPFNQSENESSDERPSQEKRLKLENVNSFECSTLQEGLLDPKPAHSNYIKYPNPFSYSSAFPQQLGSQADSFEASVFSNHPQTPSAHSYARRMEDSDLLNHLIANYRKVQSDLEKVHCEKLSLEQQIINLNAMSQACLMEILQSLWPNSSNTNTP